MNRGCCVTRDHRERLPFKYAVGGKSELNSVFRGIEYHIALVNAIDFGLVFIAA